jgi:hypothetical protein
MPAKFKPSERVYDRNARGVRMNTHNPVKKMKHYYLKNQSKETLFAEINKYNVKPKQRQKCLNELARRGIVVVWREKDAG